MKSSAKTLLLSLSIVVLSALLLYLALNTAGEFSLESKVEDMPKLSQQQTLPGITEDDYINYALNFNSVNDYAKIFVIPEGTLLSAEEAVVLAAKQVEDLTGDSLGGLKFDITSAYSEMLQISAYETPEELLYTMDINPITGRLESFYKSQTSKNSKDYVYTEEDIMFCRDRALEIATNYFGFNEQSAADLSGDRIGLVDTTYNGAPEYFVTIVLSDYTSLYFIFCNAEKQLYNMTHK